jgi:group I intron endonuclease
MAEKVIDKRKIKEHYKQTVLPMGIYQIKNLVNGKVFIGSAKNLPGKFNSHRFQLKQGSHMNRALQEDYSHFGEKKFSFEVLDYLEPKEDPKYDYAADLAVLEEMWIEKLQPYGERGYNKRKGLDRR